MQSQNVLCVTVIVSVQLYKLVPEMGKHYGWDQGSVDRIMVDHDPKQWIGVMMKKHGRTYLKE